jgi:protease I
MAEQDIAGLRVAIVVTDGFERVELVEPRKALDRAGARSSIVSPKTDKVRSWNHIEWAEEFPVDLTVRRARAEDFDALLLPGGVINPDKLRLEPEALAFISELYEAGKPIAAICHGPWTLIEVGAVKGRRVASWPSLQTDLINAGAEWVDREVVRDGPLVTSRKPDDLPAFNREMIRLFAEHRGGMGREARSFADVGRAGAATGAGAGGDLFEERGGGGGRPARP